MNATESPMTLRERLTMLSHVGRAETPVVR